MPISCWPGFVPNAPPTREIPDALAYPLVHEFVDAQLLESGSFVPPAMVMLPPYEFIDPIIAIAPPPLLSVSLYIVTVNGLAVVPLIDADDAK